MTIMIPRATRLVRRYIPLIGGFVFRLGFKFSLSQGFPFSHHLNLFILSVTVFFSFV